MTAIDELVVSEPHPAERVRLYVWQVPVRLTHWVTAGPMRFGRVLDTMMRS